MRKFMTKCFRREDWLSFPKRCQMLANVPLCFCLHVLTLWVTRMFQRWDSICSPSVNPPSVGIIKISWTPMYTENNSIIRRFTIKAIPATIWLRVRVLSTAPGNPRLSHAAFREIILSLHLDLTQSIMSYASISNCLLHNTMISYAWKRFCYHEIEGCLIHSLSFFFSFFCKEIGLRTNYLKRWSILIKFNRGQMKSRKQKRVDAKNDS